MAIKHSFHFTDASDITLTESGNPYFPVSLAFDGEAVSDDGFYTPLRAGMALTRKEATELRDRISDLLDGPLAGERPDNGYMFFELSPDYLSRLATAHGWAVAAEDSEPAPPAQGTLRIDAEYLDQLLRNFGLKLVGGS